MMHYDWTINGGRFSDQTPLQIKQGQRAVLTFNNTTTMWHPMHLHGHTFQIIRPDGSRGARKDTAIVLPNQKISVVLVADNPGIWLIALPQHLPPRSRHDDQPQLHHLTPGADLGARQGGQSRFRTTRGSRLMDCAATIFSVRSTHTQLARHCCISQSTASAAGAASASANSQNAAYARAP